MALSKQHAILHQNLMMNHATDLDAIREAATRIAPHAHRTPVITCRALDTRADRQLFFKCENLQKVGAFKFRGACNAVFSLDANAAARGVVTHSSGNHAQAVALAAALRGVSAHVVMPEDSTTIKRQATRDYGARIYACASTLEARETGAEAVIRDTGATMIPPYDHPHIIAGQGTAALELLEEVPELDVVVAPIGGGGLMAGTCLAVRGIAPRVRLIGAEPAGADDAARSLAAGRLIPQTDPRTMADGLRTSLGNLTWPILRDHLAAIITIDEDTIAATMRMFWERTKLIIEPSAAVAVASVLHERFDPEGSARRVGIILSGGNLDLETLPWTRART